VPKIPSFQLGTVSGGSTLGPGGHSPPPPQILPRPPKFLDTVVLLLVELIGSIVISLKFRLAVVASQMMRGQQARIQRGVTGVETLPQKSLHKNFWVYLFASAPL